MYHSTRSIKEISDELIAEELRKVLISLNQGDSKEAISPNELFSAIWKVVPRFRQVLILSSQKLLFTLIFTFSCMLRNPIHF